MGPERSAPSRALGCCARTSNAQATKKLDADYAEGAERTVWRTVPAEFARRRGFGEKARNSSPREIPKTPTLACADGVRRCHMCFDAKYIAAHVSSATSRCSDCTQLVSEHQRFVRDFLDRWQQENRGKRWSTLPGLLERLGLQAARSFETRPAAAWTETERLQRAQTMLESYQRALSTPEEEKSTEDLAELQRVLDRVLEQTAR